MLSMLENRPDIAEVQLHFRLKFSFSGSEGSASDHPRSKAPNVLLKLSPTPLKYWVRTGGSIQLTLLSGAGEYTQPERCYIKLSFIWFRFLVVFFFLLFLSLNLSLELCMVNRKKKKDFWRAVIQNKTFMHKDSLEETLRKVVLLTETKEALAFRRYCCKHNQKVWVNNGIVQLKVELHPVILMRKPEAEGFAWWCLEVLQSCVRKHVALSWPCLQTDGPTGRKYGACCVW